MDEQISSRILYNLTTLRLEDRNSWRDGMEEVAEKFVVLDQTFKKWIKTLG